MFLLTDVLVFFFFFSYAEVVFTKLFKKFNGTSECLKWFLKTLSILYFFLFVFFLFVVNVMNFKTVIQKMLTGEN